MKSPVVKVIWSVLAILVQYLDLLFTYSISYYVLLPVWQYFLQQLFLISSLGICQIKNYVVGVYINLFIYKRSAAPQWTVVFAMLLNSHLCAST